LLRFAVDEGQRRGKAALALYVVDRNTHARAVYEHLGFRVIRTEHMLPLAPLVGFRRAHYMELPLASP
jgi:ribosomal protein S18 acetylase RimI-like enzyme